MPYYPSGEEWYRQSSLLLQARPTTTRVTTKYTIPNLDSSKYAKKRERNEAARARRIASGNAAASTETTESAQIRAPRAYLELKTYDPESGVSLKYKTEKSAEVGRLIGSLGRLSRHMAALPEIKEDTTMLDAPALDNDTERSIPQPEATITDTSKGQGTGGGGGKKKKKGKK